MSRVESTGDWVSKGRAGFDPLGLGGVRGRVGSTEDRVSKF